jgi:hypothetical protein
MAGCGLRAATAGRGCRVSGEDSVRAVSAEA